MSMPSGPKRDGSLTADLDLFRRLVVLGRQILNLPDHALSADDLPENNVLVV